MARTWEMLRRLRDDAPNGTLYSYVLPGSLHNPSNSDAVYRLYTDLFLHPRRTIFAPLLFILICAPFFLPHILLRSGIVLVRPRYQILDLAELLSYLLHLPPPIQVVS